jgi:hypothetical protein
MFSFKQVQFISNISVSQSQGHLSFSTVIPGIGHYRLLRTRASRITLPGMRSELTDGMEGYGNGFTMNRGQAMLGGKRRYTTRIDLL